MVSDIEVEDIVRLTCNEIEEMSRTIEEKLDCVRRAAI